MREIRQSGSEGGGGGASPYPYSSGRVPRPMAGPSAAMTVRVTPEASRVSCWRSEAIPGSLCTLTGLPLALCCF